MITLVKKRRTYNLKKTNSNASQWWLHVLLFFSEFKSNYSIFLSRKDSKRAVEFTHFIKFSWFKHNSSHFSTKFNYQIRRSKRTTSWEIDHYIFEGGGVGQFYHCTSFFVPIIVYEFFSPLHECFCGHFSLARVFSILKPCAIDFFVFGYCPTPITNI